MIEIQDKCNCCGCSSCVQACPKQCIHFDEDEEGFRYPTTNKNECIKCGICEKVCPCINEGESQNPLKVYAAINSNEEIRMNSSSGGAFSMLAQSTIDDGGIVFGARFDENWEVMHDSTDSAKGLAMFRGSKYLQSRIGNTYNQALSYLKDGRKVLYSGTGCQIAGLKRFLRKEYDNLLTVEIICHSVPSPLVWRRYLKEVTCGNEIYSVNFRNKRTGWSNYSYSIVINHKNGEYSEPASGPYMKGLTSNLTTRPSCSNCPSRLGKSGADILLGDCWGIWDIMPKLDDNKGVSLVEIFTAKGEDAIKRLKNEIIELPHSQLSVYNAGLQEPHPCHKAHDLFFQDIKYSNTVSDTLKKYQKTPIISTKDKIKALISKMLH